jgi:hypothetical protein
VIKKSMACAVNPKSCKAAALQAAHIAMSAVAALIAKATGTELWVATVDYTPAIPWFYFRNECFSTDTTVLRDAALWVRESSENDGGH